MKCNLMRAVVLISTLGVVGAWGQTDPYAQNRLLGRGINIPGVFDRSGAAVPDPPMKAEYFKLISDAGFHNVRLVLRWSSYALAEAPYTIDAGFLKKVDWAVAQSISNKLAVVLDFHYYPLISFTGGATSQEDPAKNRARFLALWEQIAAHYREAPLEVMFGILNEPSRPNLGIDGWNGLIAETIPLVRRTNPNRTILVQTANGGGFGSLDSLRIPEGERNAIVEVHYYDPGKFTHQQASWSANRIYKDIHWTEAAEETAAVDEAFGKAAAWGKTNNRPLYLGEFGAYQAADMPSRVKWTNYVSRAAEKARMSFAYWGFWRCGFDLFDGPSGGWSEGLLKALIP